MPEPRALERELRAAGVALDWPPTPELAEAVGTRLRELPAPRARRVRRLRAAPAVALAVLALGGTAAAFPDARDSILEWLGLRSGVEVERVPGEPRPQRLRGAAALGLGERVTAAEARARAAFGVVRLDIGTPDSVWFGSVPPGGQVTHVYRPGNGLPESRVAGVGLLFSQFSGGDALAFIRKEIGPGTRVEEVTVGGEPGVFLSGAPHTFAYRGADGAVRRETLRLAGNTLIWVRGDLTLRIEGELSRAEALAIARRAAPG